jgi:hypothetical protein
MTTFEDELVAAARELSRAGRWPRALALLDAAKSDAAESDATESDATKSDAAASKDDRIALVAAEIALEQDWWTGSDEATARLAAAPHGWEREFLRLRNDYLHLIHAPGGRFDPGPWGKDEAVIAELERRGDELRATAPDPVAAGWAAMYRGLIADNLRADRTAAPAYYRVALATTGDDLLTREALRHLGDHDHDDGDHAAALDRWRRATALGAGAGAVPGTLSQQLLLAVLARDAGDEAGAVALAAEVARWAGALGATRIESNAREFVAGADPTAPPRIESNAREFVAGADPTAAPRIESGAIDSAPR